MKNTANEPGILLIVEYTGIIDEAKLNWGFRDNYFGEEKIPVLFIFSNFPHVKKTNRQSLVGSIRAYVEEKKGIIFFPSKLKEDVKQFILEALRKEKIVLQFLPYSRNKYNPDYLSQICDTCFSIKNINLQEIIKIGTPSTQQPKDIKQIYRIHWEMIENLRMSKNEDVTCFIMDKSEKQIVESLHLEQTPSKRKASFDDIVKDRAFKTRFFDLFSGGDSIPDRIKRYYDDGKNWKFNSLLIFYSNRKSRTFIQDLEENAFFLNAGETTFMSCNTNYSLLSLNYESKPDQSIIITRNDIAQRFDISVDGKTVENPTRKHVIMSIFPGCTESVNQFLQLITHTRLNEARFYYDKKAVFIKVTGIKYTIDAYEVKQEMDYPEVLKYV